MRAAHQRHGDADEAGARDEVELHAAGSPMIGLSAIMPASAPEIIMVMTVMRVSDDAGIARRLRAVAHGAHLVAELGAPDQHPDAEGRDQRQQERRR